MAIMRGNEAKNPPDGDTELPRKNALFRTVETGVRVK